MGLLSVPHNPLIKPDSWGFNPAYTSPEWRWFWDSALIAAPMWSGGGDVMRNYGKLGTTANGSGVAGKWSQKSDGTGIDTGYGDSGMGFVANSLLPTSACTVVVRYHKLDGTNRASALFGNAGAANFSARLGVHGPYSSGVVSWDFAGNTAGSTRVQVGGQIFEDAVWCFTVGPRGMEIWKNGILLASNVATPTRTPSSSLWTIGEHGTINADAVHYSGISLHDTQLTSQQIQELAVDFHGPFRFDYSQFWGGAVTPPLPVNIAPPYSLSLLDTARILAVTDAVRILSIIDTDRTLEVG